AGDWIGRAARLQAVAGSPRRSGREGHPPGRRGASHPVRRHRLFAVLRSTGLHQVLGQGVASLAPDRPRRVLLVALGVAPFLESVIGFGVGMIMAAPNCGSLGSRRGWPRWWPCWPWSAYRGALGPRARWSRQNWPASTSTPSAPPPPA